MAWLADAAIKTAIARKLKVDEADLEAWWDGEITEANAKAKAEIIGEFISRDLTAAQAESWDRSNEFQKDMAMFWAFTAASLTVLDGAMNSESLKALDRRKDLRDCEALINEAEIEVAATGGRVTIGALDDTDDTITSDWEW